MSDQIRADHLSPAQLTSRTPTSCPTEPDGGVEGSIQDHHHVPVVPALVRYIVFEQEGLAGGEDHVFTLSGLFPRIRW